MKPFDELNREYERWCDRLPGGPDDPEWTDEEIAAAEERKLELVIERCERRREAHFEEI
jgi:hypothetical protein